MFVYLCAYTMLSPMAWMQAVSHTAVGIASMVFMSVVYLGATIVLNRIY